MSRDELAQLLLTYIGTAADIIEFFDSFKVRSGNRSFSDHLYIIGLICFKYYNIDGTFQKSLVSQLIYHSEF